MLNLTIESTEQWNEQTNEFTSSKAVSIQLEHSLVSLSKWESKWNKPWLSNVPKTDEETLDYIKCMTVTPKVDPIIYTTLNGKHIQLISEYIESSMTATTFNTANKGGPKEIITAEIIYYHMISLNIPFECQKWHLNRLITLIQVCDIKSQPPKKMSRQEMANRNAALNASRKAAMATEG